MVTITPGNLGVNEWVVALIGKLLSFDVATGLLVALVFRGMSLAAQVLGGSSGGVGRAPRRAPVITRPGTLDGSTHFGHHSVS